MLSDGTVVVVGTSAGTRDYQSFRLYHATNGELARYFGNNLLVCMRLLALLVSDLAHALLMHTQMKSNSFTKESCAVTLTSDGALKSFRCAQNTCVCVCTGC